MAFSQAAAPARKNSEFSPGLSQSLPQTPTAGPKSTQKVLGQGLGAVCHPQRWERASKLHSPPVLLSAPVPQTASPPHFTASHSTPNVSDETQVPISWGGYLRGVEPPAINPPLSQCPPRPTSSLHQPFPSRHRHLRASLRSRRYDRYYGFRSYCEVLKDVK